MRNLLVASFLLSSLCLPVAVKASTPADDMTAPTPIRVSTGVTAPVLVSSPVITLPDTITFDLIPQSAQVELSMTIDEKGHPENIKVVKSFNPFVDGRVVDAVSNFHFHPSTIDHKPTAVNMDLTVTVTH